MDGAHKPHARFMVLSGSPVNDLPANRPISQVPPPVSALATLSVYRRYSQVADCPTRNDPVMLETSAFI